MKKIRIIEAFSGIGSQVKALQRLDIDYEIYATIEWDINAFIAYDLIHNGKQNLTPYEKLTREEIVKELKKYTLSFDGKNSVSKNSYKRRNIKVLRRVLSSIHRCKNLVSITDVKGEQLPEDIDLFTYSFPCQDLSISGVFHGKKYGIDRDANTRSGLLWEVERILKEMNSSNKKLPKFLLMENVKNILSSRHKGNFEEWQDYLESIGYYNKIYCLNSKNFGIPQSRERVYMLSVFIGKENRDKKQDILNNYFKKNDLSKKRDNLCSLENYLRLDYSIEKYKKEAEESNPNDTPSRRNIYKDNLHIFDGKILKKEVKTLTTKQDRNPNSGVIEYPIFKPGKSRYRNLTPRECFLLMGFDENDFDILKKYDFSIGSNRHFFSREKLIKMAGNSIVVNVLEEIFKQMKDIEDNILKNKIESYINKDKC